MKYVYQIDHVYFISSQRHYLLDCIYQDDHISLARYLALLPKQDSLVMVNQMRHIMIRDTSPYETLHLKEASTVNHYTSFILE